MIKNNKIEYLKKSFTPTHQMSTAYSPINGTIMSIITMTVPYIMVMAMKMYLINFLDLSKNTPFVTRELNSNEIKIS